MKPDPILKEIRQTRDDLARETGYDLQRLFDYVRERARESAARGLGKFTFDIGKGEGLPSLCRELGLNGKGSGECVVPGRLSDPLKCPVPVAVTWALAGSRRVFTN